MLQDISELNLAPISNERLVNFINYQLPITNQLLKKHIIKEFENRKLDYRHLYDLKTGELDIKYPLYLIDNCLFVLNTPKPPLVGNFYSAVKKLEEFLIKNPELEGKKIKTFNYIFDQLFLDKNIVKIITEDEIDELTEKDVFITFKNINQHFPNQLIVNKILLKKTIIITIDKGNLYRGFKNVSILKNGQTVKKMDLLFK